MNTTIRNLVIAIACLAGLNSVYALNWGSDISSALEKATEEKKCVFLLFTGSDWCPYCKTLEDKVLSTPEFKKFAEENLILVKYDKKKKISKSKGEKISELMKEYNAPGFPSILILNPANEKLGMLGSSDNAEVFITQLQSMVGKYDPKAAKQDPIEKSAKESAVTSENIPEAAAASEKEPEKAKYSSRTWTNAEGKTVKATLVSFDDTTVVLQSVSGRKSKLPREKLSEADNEYLNSLPIE